jgi:hypothetical protein
MSSGPSDLEIEGNVWRISGNEDFEIDTDERKERGECARQLNFGAEEFPPET